jgi:hypothetical protein
MTDTPGAALAHAREQAAKELGLPVDSGLVQRFAVLSVAHEAVQALVASGHINDTSISNLLKLDEALAALRAAAPPKPVNVSIRFVGEPETCPQCGYHYSGEGPMPVPKLIEGKVENNAAGRIEDSEDKRTTGHGKPGAGPSVEATRKLPPPPPRNPERWSDGPADKQYAKAVNFTQGVEGYVKRSAWSGSAALFGPAGGAVKRSGGLPGEPDRRPMPSGEYGRKP